MPALDCCIHTAGQRSGEWSGAGLGTHSLGIHFTHSGNCAGNQGNGITRGFCVATSSQRRQRPSHPNPRRGCTVSGISPLPPPHGTERSGALARSKDTINAGRIDAGCSIQRHHVWLLDSPDPTRAAVQYVRDVVALAALTAMESARRYIRTYGPSRAKKPFVAGALDAAKAVVLS